MNIGQLSIEFLLLALRIAVVFLLYLFLYQVLRVITRELRMSGAEATPASEYGYLTVINPGQTGLEPGKRFPLNQVNTIGRAMTNDIPLNDNFLSAEHALLEWDGSTWIIEDLGSTNGTWLNGREVVQPTPLTYGDIIQLGHVELKLSR
ncbi:FHA domain-containing protein [Kallotenue papyrolyticum]|uniref:FHA domain-containing protein n=1 Tax=Kallotenue papyrolyticum TaxID=1325125 RepID=UPI0004785CB3|nr:FHA domain-containing protein [Kallotenue papyrolyticum]